MVSPRATDSDLGVAPVLWASHSPADVRPKICRKKGLVDLVVRIECGVVEDELHHLEEVVLEGAEVGVVGWKTWIVERLRLLTQEL